MDFFRGHDCEVMRVWLGPMGPLTSGLGLFSCRSPVSKSKNREDERDDYLCNVLFKDSPSLHLGEWGSWVRGTVDDLLVEVRVVSLFGGLGRTLIHNPWSCQKGWK